MHPFPMGTLSKEAAKLMVWLFLVYNLYRNPLNCTMIHLEGNFQFIDGDTDWEKEFLSLSDDNFDDFDVHQRDTTRNSYRNRIDEDDDDDIQYLGYQHPSEIDWSQYGPDRPGKKKKKEYAQDQTGTQRNRDRVAVQREEFTVRHTGTRGGGERRRKPMLQNSYKNKRRNTLLKTHWNQNAKSGNENRDVPYAGYQHPDEIDWSQYGPDRPGKKKNEEYVASNSAFENSFVAKMSFFGLLLPGIMGTLFFLGVPIAKAIF